MQVRFNMVSCFVIRPTATGNAYEMLQLLRRADDYMGGTWQTIYGQSEPDETAVAAALRELREETRLFPREFYRLERVGIFYTVIDDTLWHTVKFCAIVGREDRVVLNTEHSDFRWLGFDEAIKQIMWEDDRQTVFEIQRDILSDSLSKPHVRIALPPRG